MNSRRQVLYTAAAIIICIMVFSVTPLDLWFQHLLYDGSSHDWLWSRHEPIKRFVLYDGIKALLVLFTLGLILLLLFDGEGRLSPQRRSGIVLVVLSMMIAPATVSLLKWTTDIACPRAVLPFGGLLPYDDLITHLTSASAYPELQRCFPAGHASGGFALLSLVFLFDSRRARVTAMTFALALGWTMGFYKMAIGDHFLSHTVVSMLVDWLVINLTAMLYCQWVTQSASTPAMPVILRAVDRSH